MAAKLPVGALAPQEIITDLLDKRLFEETLAGAFNNRAGVFRHLVAKGLIEVGSGEQAGFADPLDSSTYNRLLKNPEISREHNEWYLDLYMGGVRRLFGNRAANRQTEVRTTQSRYDTHPLAVPVYVGELPPVLEDEATVDALQQRLDLRYGKHGVLAGPPPVVMALYEDVAVSLRPAARTLIQGKTEVWQLEAHTNLRGPGTARMAA